VGGVGGIGSGGENPLGDEPWMAVSF
jgi:hypothetical protein